jgi:hypothetical protein
MRGIERVLGAILLLVAVAGAAVFARQSGSGLAGAIHLAAPPEQHLGAPGSVLIAPTASADHSQRVLRLAVPTLLTPRPALSGKITPLRPATLVPARTQPRRVPGAPTAAPSPSPTPARPTPTPPTPAPTPVAAPTETVAAPVQAPPRVVASTQPEPAPAPAPAPATPAAPIKSTPLPPVAVTSENVHGLAATPQPPVNSAPSSNDASTIETEPVQAVHVKDVAH